MLGSKRGDVLPNHSEIARLQFKNIWAAAQCGSLRPVFMRVRTEPAAEHTSTMDLTLGVVNKALSKISRMGVLRRVKGASFEVRTDPVARAPKRS